MVPGVPEDQRMLINDLSLYRQNRSPENNQQQPIFFFVSIAFLTTICSNLLATNKCRKYSSWVRALTAQHMLSRLLGWMEAVPRDSSVDLGEYTVW